MSLRLLPHFHIASLPDTLCAEKILAHFPDSGSVIVNGEARDSRFAYQACGIDARTAFQIAKDVSFTIPVFIVGEDSCLLPEIDMKKIDVIVVDNADTPQSLQDKIDHLRQKHAPALAA